MFLEPPQLGVVRVPVAPGDVRVDRASRLPRLLPRVTMRRPHLYRAELVDADHLRVGRRFRVELGDPLFLGTNSGSLLSFQVLVRWNGQHWLRPAQPQQSIYRSNSLV